MDNIYKIIEQFNFHSFQSSTLLILLFDDYSLNIYDSYGKYQGYIFHKNINSNIQTVMQSIFYHIYRYQIIKNNQHEKI